MRCHEEALCHIKAPNPDLGLLVSGNREVLKPRLLGLQKVLHASPMRVEDTAIDDIDDESDGDPFDGLDSD